MDRGHSRDAAVAIIGMAGRFPNAKDLDEFWRNLARGVDCVRRFGREQAMAAGLHPDIWDDPDFVPANGVLEDGDRFDAGFFRYTPREAELIDPQQRLFLECAWRALESAGYPSRDFAGRIGLFAGSGYSYYLIDQMRGDCARPASGSSFLRLMGNDKDYLVTRAAYKLDFRGPCLNLATACSTSLVAVHMACQSLLSGECDMALAGGVKINSPQLLGHMRQDDSAFSADGRNLAFKRRASGTVGGNGVGLVALKGYERALRDGDNIRAVILGSAIGNDGADKIGYTAPGRRGQAQVIAEALAMAGVEPASLGYLEAHGTATALGDELEVLALKDAFAQADGRKNFCALGTVKSNIGHLDAAAGVAGLIKTVLMLEHRTIPPDPHLEEANPALDLANSPFYLNHEPRPWPEDSPVARAGVSSFGVGGVNAHLVVEQPPDLPRVDQGGPGLFVISAPSPGQLRRLAQEHLARLRREEALVFSDYCFSSGACRAHFAWRKAFVADNASHLADLLASWLADGQAKQVSEADSTPTLGLRLTMPEAGVIPAEKLQKNLTALARRLAPFARGLETTTESWRELRGGEPEGHDLLEAALLASGLCLGELLARPVAVEAPPSLSWIATAWIQGLDPKQALAVQPPPPPAQADARQAAASAMLELSLDGEAAAFTPFGWLGLLGAAYEAGLTPAWRKLWDKSKLRRMELPPLPMETKPYYIGPGLGVSQIAADLQTWEALTREADHVGQRTAHVLTPEQIPQERELMEDLSASFIARALARAGAFAGAGRRTTVEDVVERIGVQKDLAQLCGRLLSGLARAGLLQADAKGYWDPTPPGEAEHEDMLRRSRAMWANNPTMRDIYPEIGENLLAILKGEKDLREIYFPDGELGAAQAIYADLPTSRFFNGLMAALAAVIAKSPGRSGLRVLEVGAGTGATTQALLESLPDSIAEYCFSDVSRHFLEHARAKFAGRPFMTYRLFDIERPPREQGLVEGGYDLVVAANSAHVARDMGQAASHLRRLLKPGGHLLLYEITENDLLGEMTTALLLPPIVDLHRRPDGPFLSGEGWRRLLTEQGFSCAASFPAEDRPEALVGERVIVAWADGRGAGLERAAIAEPPTTLAESPRPALTEEAPPRLYRTAWIAASGQAAERPSAEARPRLVLAPDADDAAKALDLARLHQKAGARAAVLTGRPAGDARAIQEQLLALADGTGRAEVVWLAPNPWARLADASGEQMQAVAEEACQSFLALTEALDGLPWSLQATFMVVDRSSATAGEVVHPLAGLWLSFGRVMSLGHPELNLRMVEAGPENDAGMVAAALVDRPGEDWWALREGAPWLPRLEPLTAVPSVPISVSPEASYLLAGGLGGLGLELAGRLAERGARRLLLLSRGEPRPHALAVLRRLEDQGVRVRTLRADLADAEALRRALTAAGRDFPPIRGVAHLAVSGDWDDARLGPGQRLAKVMRPKVAGGWNLHLATQGLELDFFWLFSSAVTMTPVSGLPDYAGANGFLEALARHRRGLGLPGLAVAWGSWSGAGAVAADPLRDRLARQGLTPLTPTQGLDLLEAAQASGLAVVGAMSMDWDRRLASLGGAPPAYYQLLAGRAKPPGGGDAGPTLVERLRLAEPDQRPAMLRHYLVETFAAILKLPPAELDPEMDLVRVGLDSLMFLDVAGIIGRELGVRINPKDLYRNFTIASIAERFLATMGDLPEQPVRAREDALGLERFFTPDTQNRHEPFPLTDMQQAYWVGRRADFEMGNVAAHGYVELEGQDWDIAALNQAWQKVVERHDMFRAVILDNGTQRILPETPSYEFRVHDLSDLDDQGRQERIAQIRAEMSHQIQDPGQWPLFDIRISLLGGGRMRLHFSLDNLTTDGRSLNIFMGEWVELYFHPQKELPPLDLCFRDYVMALRRFQASADYAEIWSYWEKRLDDLPNAPILPMVKSPDQIQRPVFVRHGLGLDQKRWGALKLAAKERGLTLPGLLAAAYAEVLCRYGGQQRITLNLPTFNRLPVHHHVNRILGEFTSLLFLEVDNSQPLPFVQRAQAVQAQIFSDLDRGGYVSGVQILRELARRRGGGNKAMMPVVFSSMFGLASQEDAFAYDFAAMEKFGQQVTGISQTPQVWLDNHIHEAKGCLNIYWDAVEELFPPGLIAEMFAVYKQLLADLAEKPETWSAVSPLTWPEERRRARLRYNQTEAPLPEATIHQLFRESAAARPQAEAIVQGGRRLSYDEVGRRATAVAGLLRLLGLTPNQTVAVACRRGWEQAVAALAVLEAGGAYVPMDPDAPAKRLEMLLARSQARMVLTQSDLLRTITWPKGLVTIAIDQTEPADPGTSALAPMARATDLAYVIYTSGSTGEPKGVAIDHRGAVNTILDINRRFAVGPNDAVLALSAFNFDLSVYDIFGLWAAGGKVVMIDHGRHRDPEHWRDLLIGENITLWNSVPGLMQMLLESLEDGGGDDLGLRQALLSGDWIALDLPPRMRRLLPGCAIHSLGGATEASIWSIQFPVEGMDPAWKSIPYGYPLTNQTIHVLDARLDECPDWVVGEIHIGGVGLAREYWGDPEKTTEKFVIHPRTGQRLYRTGDLGRFLPQGYVEFLGRQDHQVKIGGHRIELGEIESVFRKELGVSEALVTAVGDPRRRSGLAAYLVAKEADLPWATTPLAAPRVKVEKHWSAVAKAGLSKRPPAVEDEAAWRPLELLHLQATRKALQGLDAFPDDAPRSIQALAASLGLAPRHAKWLSRAVAALERADFLRRASDDRLAPTTKWRQPLDPTIWPRAEELLRDAMGCDQETVDLLRIAVDGLADILTGDSSAWLSANQAADRLCHRAFDGLNQGLARLAEALLDVAEPAAILELGAGHCSLLERLAPLCQDRRHRYVLANSPETAPAQAAAAELAFVEHGLYDLDQDPMTQGYGGGRFDLILAANTLHAARDLRRTVAGLSRLLKPGGMLLATEATAFHPWLDLSLGLRPGFGLFQDHQLRPDHPWLDRPGWEQCLREAGFARIQALHDPAAGRGPNPGAILLAAQAPAETAVFDPAKVAKQLERHLPHYMIPRHYFLLAAWPLTANGKRDRKALPAPDGQTVAQSAGRPPQGTKELILAKAWASLLGLEQVGAGDNFFESGGDSLLATRLTTMLKREGHQLALSHVFAEPVLARMAMGLSPLANTGPIVELKPGRGAPVVFIHAADGGVEAYGQLAQRLRTGRPAFGLPEDELCAEESMAQTARRYAQMIAARWPGRQPTLAGFSSGGVLAWLTTMEMERQSAATPPILVDAQFGSVDEAPIAPEQWLQAFAWAHGRVAWPANADNGRGEEALAREMGLPTHELRQKLEAFRRRMESMPGGPDGGRTRGLVYIRATGRLGADDQQLALWRAACRGPLKLFELDLGHFQCLAQDGLALVSQAINEALAEEGDR